MFLQLFEGFIRNISGKAGIIIRRIYYRLRLADCGKKLVIAEGVFIDNPRNIYLGDNIWIDRNVIMMAGTIVHSDNIKYQENFDEDLQGRIIIGSYSHIGIGTIMQGPGGIRTGKYFTTSANCKIYTFSNDPDKCHEGTVPHDQYNPHYVMSQVIINDNVWLGFNVSVVGGSIGENTFIKPNSVIKMNIEDNSVMGGDPVRNVRSRF